MLADADVVGVGGAGQPRPPRGAVLVDADALREDRRWQPAGEREHRAVAAVDRPVDADPSQSLSQRLGGEMAADLTAGEQPRALTRAATIGAVQDLSGCADQFRGEL